MNLVNLNKRTILADVKVGKISSSTSKSKSSGCGCIDDKFVANILMKLGMPHASKMHLEHDKEWTPNDLDMHAKEEDDKLFPMLKTVIQLENDKSDIKIVNQLYKDHFDFVYPYVVKNLMPPKDKMDIHAKKENYLIKKYYKRLITLYGKNNNSTVKSSGNQSLVKTGSAILELPGYKSTSSQEIVAGAIISGLVLLVGAPILIAAIPLIGVAGYNAYQKYEDNKKKFQLTEITTKISGLELSLWENSGSIPSDKLNNRGQKFIDPYAIEGACWSIGGMENLMLLPKDGRVRVEYMHRNAQTSKPIVMPAADALVAASGEFKAQAINKVGADIKARQRWWADQISKYARYTGNGYVIAVAELYAAFLRWMPETWNREYGRAVMIAEDEADQLKVSLLSTIGFGFPYPLHTLDGEISDLEDLKARNRYINGNLKKTLVLPQRAKELLRSWFALLVSMIAEDTDVQSAVTYVDNSDWGKKNLASDEQVYLVGVVLAKALGFNIVDFTTELWNRSKGWNRFKGLATNSHIVYLKTANGKSESSGTSQNGGFVYEQDEGRKNLGKWSNSHLTDNEFGHLFSANCITNARQLNWIDIILTGYQIAAERGHKGLDPIDGKKMIKLNTV